MKEFHMDILEFEIIAPDFEKAGNLMNQGRYKEAEVILFRHYVPELLAGTHPWHVGHSCAEQYALCLQNIPGRLEQALEIYSKLNLVADKPSEFYLNYSLALLRASKWSEAEAICRQGLKSFPDDLQILGNFTISLVSCGRLEEAQTVAATRLSMQRNINSIEEVVYTLSQQRIRMRNSDMPRAVEIASIENKLINEGLSINPDYGPLKIAEIKLLRFAKLPGTASDVCGYLMKNDRFSEEYKQLAFCEMVETVCEIKEYQMALSMIEKTVNTLSFEPAIKRATFIKWRIYAQNYMIGRDNEKGERVAIREAADFFLQKDSGVYPYPVLAARVLEWLGNGAEAESILHQIIAIESSDSWDACKYLILLLEREGRIQEALMEGKKLVEIAPWRAESYDLLSFVEGRLGQMEQAAEIKNKGDEIFQKELQLFDMLQKVLKGEREL